MTFPTGVVRTTSGTIQATAARRRGCGEGMISGPPNGDPFCVLAVTQGLWGKRIAANVGRSRACGMDGPDLAGAQPAAPGHRRSGRLPPEDSAVSGLVARPGRGARPSPAFAGVGASQRRRRRHRGHRPHLRHAGRTREPAARLARVDGRPSSLPQAAVLPDGDDRRRPPPPLDLRQCTRSPLRRRLRLPDLPPHDRRRPRGTGRSDTRLGLRLRPARGPESARHAGRRGGGEGGPAAPSLPLPGQHGAGSRLPRHVDARLGSPGAGRRPSRARGRL